MSLETNEIVSQQYAIPEFFEFFYNGIYKRYVAWESNLTFLGNEYTSKPVARLGFTEDTNYISSEVDLRTPIIDALSRYAANTPTDPTTIRIYRALITDLTDYDLIFEGAIMSVHRKNFILQAKCSSDAKLLETYYPDITYQSYCNWEVFGVGCTLDEVIYKVSLPITNISNSDYTASGLNAYSDGYFKGGTAYYLGDERMITNHIGNVVTLQLPFDSRVAIDSSVDFYPGCDGSPSTCKNKFNNYSNFVGMPLIPSSNPVIWGL